MIGGRLRSLSNLIALHLPHPTPPPPPPLHVNDIIYSDNTDKANISYDYFTEQPSLDDRNANLPAGLDILDFILNAMSITANEVESVLKSLRAG